MFGDTLVTVPRVGEEEEDTWRGDGGRRAVGSSALVRAGHSLGLQAM